MDNARIQIQEQISKAMKDIKDARRMRWESVILNFMNNTFPDEVVIEAILQKGYDMRVVQRDKYTFTEVFLSKKTNKGTYTFLDERKKVRQMSGRRG